MTGSHPSVLEEALGARSKVAVLRCLFDSRLGHSGSAIAKLTGTRLFAIQGALAALENLGLVTVERGRVENRYRLNRNHHLIAHGLGKLFESEREMRPRLIRDLRKLLKGKVVSAGLFGSFAKGSIRADSDIDVLVVVNNLKEYEGVTRLLADAQSELTGKYGFPVQPVVFERRRLLRRGGGGRDLLRRASANWLPITGLSLAELQET